MRAKHGEMHAGSDLAFYHRRLRLGPAHLNTHTQIHRSWLIRVPLAPLSVDYVNVPVLVCMLWNSFL